MTRKNGRLWILFAIAFGCAILALIAEPHAVPQDQNYHRFAGEPNPGNVWSNAAFLLAGLFGFWRLRRGKSELVFATGAVLTALGSTIYHLAPTDETLVYDRLGMVIAFAAFIHILMQHFDVDFRGALPLLIAIGTLTIICWLALDDLRPYAVFQGFPVVLVVLGSFLLPHVYPRHGMLWIVTAGYVLAKVCEDRDVAIYNWTHHAVSGHTLKHLVAGAAIFVAMLWLSRRRQPSAALPRAG